MNKNITFAIVGALIVVAGYVFMNLDSQTDVTTPSVNSVPSRASVETVTLTGTYECLPLLDNSQASSDCAFGIKTDEGEYYAVNFGASAGAMADFKANARITAKGIIIPSDKLTPNSWAKFNSKGLFTVLERL